MRVGASSLRMRVSRFFKLFTVIASAMVANGCGNDLAQVTGVVTVDGQPLRGGGDVRVTVIFQPSTGNGRVAVGLANADGEYRLSSGSEQGVVPGDYVVTCSAIELVRTPGGGAAGARAITDPSYANSRTSGFRFTVQPGKNEFDLALDSRAGAPARGRTP